MNSSFVNGVKNGYGIDPEEDLFYGIWSEYERVIIESLITSFGLDSLIKDQHGGDVDTIINVRQVGIDPKMQYKNQQNKEDYENRGEYNTAVYHSDPAFTRIKRSARKIFDKFGTIIPDAYLSGNKLIPRNNKTIPRLQQGQLDHVISAKRIHEDPGRVLAGLNGTELANNPSNLRFTNANLNLNKSDMTVDEYIVWCEANPDKINWNGKKGEPLPNSVKDNLRKEYGRAKKEYDVKLARAYYTSPKFMKDTASAATNRGIEMGLRQAIGFVFAEVWFVTKEEIQKIPTNSDMEFMFETVGNGIVKGFKKAQSKYKVILDKFKDGTIAGLVSSFTTTICNIFFSTAKNLVRCIRQIYASLVEAGEIIFFNPDNLLFGDRIKIASIVIATGASVLAGTIVGDTLEKTPLGMIPEIGTIVTTFASSLISGLLSCTFLVFIDRSKFMNLLITELNKIPSEANNYAEIADAMEQLAAKLENLDIDKFRADTEQYKKIAIQISKCEDENALNLYLLSAYKDLNINIPWKGNFDLFMRNRSNKLVFE